MFGRVSAVRAVLTTGHGDRGVLRYEMAFPDPTPAKGEVVVRVAATALNFHDIFTRRGMPGIRIPLPIIAGSDIAGEIVQLGEDVDGWSVGERVLVDPVSQDAARPDMIGETVHGGRAELVAVPAAQLLRVPANVSLEDAAALPLAYATAYRMLVDRGAVRAGERILVLGASGGVGVACVQIAKLLGLEVMACAGSASKAERLLTIGADHVVNYFERPFSAAVREIFGKPRVSGGGGVDVAVNFTGGDTFVETQRCVGRHGRILCCGATAGFEMATDARYLWSFEHEIVGSDGWTTASLEALLGLVASGQLKPVIDHALPLDQAAEAERMLEDREVVGKVLLLP